MNREHLSGSELDRELALSDSEEYLSDSSSNNLFGDDSDNDPTYNPDEPSTSGINNILSNIRPNTNIFNSDSESDFEVEVRPSPIQQVTSVRNVVIRPSPNANRQVISDSDSNQDTNSDWEDVGLTDSNSRPNSHFPFNETVGPKHIPSTAKDPIDFFKLFFTDQLLNMFVRETNRYAQQSMSNQNISRKSRLHAWVPVTKDEMQTFIVVIFNMGLNIKPTIKSYWSKNDSQYIPWFGKMFPRSRFENILTFFHMVDNSKLPKVTEPNYDPCQKFQPLVDYCNKTFQHFYTANQQVSIDESLIGTKSQTSLMQYLPNKHHHRWGIKFWVMCDSVSNYCLKLFCYKGAKSNEDKEDLKKYGLAYTVVKKLFEACNYLKKGYHVFMDNFFTSIPLTTWLYSEKTYVTGTIRKNKKGLPEDIKKKFNPGEKLYKKKQKIVLLAYREKKTQKKPVLLISTKGKVGDISVTNKRRGRTVTKDKPAIITDYNKFMGGIDGFDQMLYCYLDERRTVKYWKKVTFNFFSRMLLNIYILYKSTCMKNNKKPLDRYQFTISIIQQVGEHWLKERLGAGGDDGTGTQSPRELTKLPGKKEKTCWVCSEEGGHSEVTRKRKRSRTVCSRCQEGCHYLCFSKHRCK